MKKVTCLIVSFVMIINAVSVSGIYAFASDANEQPSKGIDWYESTADDYTYLILGNDFVIRSYIGDEKNVIVPKTVTIDDKIYNTSINRFNNNSLVENIFLDNVIAFNNDASGHFSNNSALKTISGTY